MQTGTENAEAIQKVGEMIKGIKIAMLSTIDEQGAVRSRPMATQQVEFDGNLWFFTKGHSGKADDVQHYQQVNLSYASPSDSRYVSVMGSGQVVNDRAKMKELWNPIYKAWFEGGIDDPDLRLLKVEVAAAEYWDSPGGKVASAINLIKSVATGKRANLGENKTVRFEDTQRS